jgi:hypothetical protein
MRALIICGIVMAGCGGSGNQNTGAASFNGSWSGTYSHPATMCSDGTPKAAFTGSTSWQINQDQAGLFLIWTYRCPIASILFAVDGMGTATQQGDPVLCIDTPSAQATMSSGTMTVAGDVLTGTIDETEHDSGTATRDCEYLLSLTMMRQ